MTMRRGGALALFLVLLAVRPSGAEEGGSGHYFPGTISSFFDGVPPTETLILRLNALYYEGSFNANKAIPIAGQAG